MTKYSVILIFLLINLSCAGQRTPQQKKSDSLSALQKENRIKNGEDESESTDNAADSIVAKTNRRLPDYQSISPAPNINKDSLQMLLKDYKIGVRIDSLWQNELTNSDLYPEMQKSIVEVPFEEKLTVKDYKELPRDTLKKRLKRLDEKTPFHINYNPDLEKMIHNYIRRNKKLMERLMALSRYYFPIFENELAKHNLPLELKYLPVVESALNPIAKSPVGATGLWQFMFTTGKLQGLTLSSYVDERMDPVKSTEAAAGYISGLYKLFDDWDLVLASYNSGPGSVSKAMRRSGGETDYWKLKRFLPRETANYVPAFIATLYVFNYAEEHGFEPYNPEIVYYETDTIRIRETIKFDRISEVTGIDQELLEFLNPSYKLDVIPHIKDKNYSVRLPIREAGLFVANEDVIYEYNNKKLVKDKKPENHKVKEKTRYRVRSGDFLGKIASRYGVTVGNLKRWNNLYNNKLKPGQSLVIYPNGSLVGKTKPKRNSSSPKIYVVQKGDSLWTISRKFSDVTIGQIKKWNGIRSSNLKPGMRLKLSGG